jgi:hypothetical protein
MAAIARQSIGIEGLLDLLEDRRVDDRLVATLALDPVERHDTDVVVVAQHPVDAVAAERFAWAFGCRPGA